jgi:hypothetical protein
VVQQHRVRGTGGHSLDTQGITAFRSSVKILHKWAGILLTYDSFCYRGLSKRVPVQL